MLRTALRAAQRARPPSAARRGAVAEAERLVTGRGARAIATSSTSSSPLAIPKEHYSINYHNAPLPEGYSFVMPRLSLIGPNSIKGIGATISKLGLSKALIVTDAFLAKSGATKVITDVLDKIGVSAAVFDGAQPNPTDKNVEDGLAALKANGCDFVISFGGGSSHDCAKAVCVMATHKGTIHDYEGLGKLTETLLPLLSVNTTAGTASEMTQFAVITDLGRKVKMVIADPRITALVAVDDPALMVGMPKGLTAATGMDALTHAVEAYMSTISNPVTDASALHAMKLISGYLRTAVHEGTNAQARDMMSYAQFLAGMAFNSAALGYVHAMAHQLGSEYNLPHGVCNAVLLPVIQEFNATVVPHRFIDVAEAMGIEYSGGADEAAAAVIAGIRQLSADVGIPRNIKELGANPKDFELFAGNALKDICSLTNPRQASAAEIVELYQKAYDQ